MKNFNKILLVLFIIFSGLFAYNVNAQGFSYSKDHFDVIFSDYDVLIYPNPVTDNKFYVKSELVIKKVEVMNVLGQNIKTVSNETNIPRNL